LQVNELTCALLVFLLSFYEFFLNSFLMLC